MRFMRRSLTGLFLVAFTLGILAYAGHMVRTAIVARLSDEPTERAPRERVLAVNVVPVTLRDVVPTLTTFGEIRSTRTLDLRAKLAGTIIELGPGFVEGGRVEAGQLLARVDPSDAKSALAVAQADLAEAEAELRDAKRALMLANDDVEAARAQAQLREQALERQKSLKDRGFGSQALVEQAELAAAAARQAVLSRRQALANAESRVDQARIEVTRARINVSEAERKLADTEIRAAFSGTLAGVSLVEGGLVANNEQIAQLIDPAQLEVAFRISAQQYERLLDEDGNLVRAEITVTLDADGAALVAKGRITRESGAVAADQTGRLLFAGLRQARGFRPGDFVTVKVEEPMLTGVAVLPATAVDAAHEVLVLGPDNRLEVASVTFLRRQGNKVIVAAPALEGRKVVAERTPLLGAGIKVQPIETAASADATAAAADVELVELTPEQRARLVALVENTPDLPADAKQRVLAQLSQDRVPASTVRRIETRMGG